MSNFNKKSTKSYCCCCGKPKNKSKIQAEYNNNLPKCKSCFNDERNQNHISRETHRVGKLEADDRMRKKLDIIREKEKQLLKYKFVFNYDIYTGKQLPTCDKNFRKENINEYIKNRNEKKFNTKLFKYY